MLKAKALCSVQENVVPESRPIVPLTAVRGEESGIGRLIGGKQNMVINSYGDDTAVEEWITSLAVELVKEDELMKAFILRLRQQYKIKMKEFSFSLSEWDRADRDKIRRLFRDEMCGIVDSVEAYGDSDWICGNLVFSPEAQLFLQGQYMEIGVYEMIRETLEELAARHKAKYKLYRNVKVSTKGGTYENEFDIVIDWNGILYVVEVKSGKQFNAWGSLLEVGEKYGIVPDRLLLVDSYLPDVRAKRIESFCRYYVSNLKNGSLKRKVTEMISKDL